LRNQQLFPVAVAALAFVSQEEIFRVKRQAKGGNGWTGVQFAAAALRLLDSPHHVVPQDDMEELLGQYADPADSDAERQAVAGEDALRSMVAGNALAVRPYSKLAQDIPKEAHMVEGRPGRVVTAPTAMSLYCMGTLRKQLQDKLDR
jgi:hypothetical protein